MDDIEELREESLKQIFECTDNVIKYLDNNTKQNKLQTLQSLIKEHSLLSSQHQVCQKALHSAQAENVDATNISSLDTKFAKNLATLMKKQPKPETHPAMKTFLSKISTTPIADLNESDLVATVTSQVYMDPFTKKQVVIPMRNKICNHIYEKSSILEMIKVKARVKCPFIGCANRNYIQQSDLIEDEDVRFQILGSQRNNERDPLALGDSD